MKAIRFSIIVAAALFLVGIVCLVQFFFGRGTFPYELPPGISVVEWDRVSGIHIYEMRVKLKGDSVDLLRTFGESMLVQSDGGKASPVVEAELAEFPTDLVPSMRNGWFDLWNVRNHIIMNFDLEIEGSSVAQVFIDTDRKLLYFVEVK